MQAPHADEKASLNRLDGWANVLTGMGTNRDKLSHTRFNYGKGIAANELEALYQSEGIAKRIIDLIPNEMVRMWVTIDGDIDGYICGKLEELNAKTKLNNLLTWSRLYGGAVMIIGANDGGDLDTPLNEAAIQAVEFLHVFDKTEVSFDAVMLYDNPNDKKYGTPQFYKITPASAAVNSSFLVHESRVLRLDGDEIPNSIRSRYDGFGAPVLESIYNEVKHFGSIFAASANIVEDFVQTIMQVENLAELIASGHDDVVLKRLEILDLSRHVGNILLLDKEEQYTKQSSSVAGIPELITRFGLRLAAVTGIPYTLLMGEAPSGLQATGAADIRMFYDMIASKQHDILLPVLERLVRLIILSHDSPFNSEPDSWHIAFNPLWQETLNEQALTRKIIAETDAIYLDRGVVDPSEIAISRFGQNGYSAVTTIDLTAREAAADIELEV